MTRNSPFPFQSLVHDIQYMIVHEYLDIITRTSLALTCSELYNLFMPENVFGLNYLEKAIKLGDSHLIKYFFEELDPGAFADPVVLRHMVEFCLESCHKESSWSVSLDVCSYLLTLYRKGKYYFLTDFFVRIAHIAAFAIARAAKHDSDNIEKWPFWKELIDTYDHADIYRYWSVFRQQLFSFDAGYFMVACFEKYEDPGFTSFDRIACGIVEGLGSYHDLGSLLNFLFASEDFELFEKLAKYHRLEYTDELLYQYFNNMMDRVLQSPRLFNWYLTHVRSLDEPCRLSPFRLADAITSCLKSRHGKQVFDMYMESRKLIGGSDEEIVLGLFRYLFNHSDEVSFSNFQYVLQKLLTIKPKEAVAANVLRAIEKFLSSLCYMSRKRRETVSQIVTLALQTFPDLKLRILGYNNEAQAMKQVRAVVWLTPKVLDEQDPESLNWPSDLIDQYFIFLMEVFEDQEDDEDSGYYRLTDIINHDLLTYLVRDKKKSMSNNSFVVGGFRSGIEEYEANTSIQHPMFYSVFCEGLLVEPNCKELFEFYAELFGPSFLELYHEKSDIFIPMLFNFILSRTSHTKIRIQMLLENLEYLIGRTRIAWRDSFTSGLKSVRWNPLHARLLEFAERMKGQSTNSG